jgi:hypothetical protein
MKRVTVRKHTQYKPDGTHITTAEFTEETSSNGLVDVAIAFMVFFSLFLGSVWLVRLMFVPSPQLIQPTTQPSNPTSNIGARL